MTKKEGDKSGKKDETSFNEKNEKEDEYLIYENVPRILYKIKKEDLEAEQLKKFRNVLLSWVQTIVYHKGIVVRTLRDVASEIVLETLYNELQGDKAVEYDSYAFTADKKKKRLELILVKIERIITFKANISKWNAVMMMNEYPPALYHLLVALYLQFNKDAALSEKVEIPVICVTEQGLSQFLVETIFDKKTVVERYNRDDAIETLMQTNPEKLNALKEIIFKFINSYLGKIGREVKDITSDFTDGVNLVILCGMLGNYFIPLFTYDAKPVMKIHKENNIKYSFELLNELGIETTYLSVSEIQSGNEKTTLKLLYSILKKYK